MNRMTISKLTNIPSREWLLDCIKALAACRSNPVREILRGIDDIESERAYPDTGLDFAGCGVHAFYHCHDAPGRPGEEHGHFHVYLYCDAQHVEEQRVHLAGLSMDRSGQPLRWFAVNRWVTGGRWLDSEALVARIPRPKTTEGLSLTESWLLAMLAVFKPDLLRLLKERDAMLNRLGGAEHAELLLENRGFYEFSTLPIDLLAKFKKAR
jgi:hypothetical protein